MQGLPLHLWLLWPLIFWRIQRLRAWFRANGGPGSQMLWSVTRDGRVVVIRLSDDFYGKPRSFSAPVSSRLREALSSTPKLPCPMRRQGRLPDSDIPVARPAASLLPLGTRLFALPPPET